MKRDVPAQPSPSSSSATSPELSGPATTDESSPNPLSHSRVWPPAWLPPMAIVIVLLMWPIVLYGAAQAWLHCQNRVEDWLPEQLPETQGLIRFFDRFGSDEFLMISWPGCLLGDPRADRLAELLVQPQTNGELYFEQAQSGTRILQSLMEEQRLSRSDARTRLYGLFIGPDGQQTCVVAAVSPSTYSNRKQAVDYAWQMAAQVTELPKSDIHIAGTTADSVAVDEASNQYLTQLNAASWSVCLIILLLSLRNIWLVGTLFITAVLNQQLALAFIYFTGGHVDSVQLLVANLSFVLTISAGLHFLGYFREAIQHNQSAPALLALRMAFVPSSLASVTTSLGFISLCTSVLLPIRSFGYYSALLIPLNTLTVIAILAIHARWASLHSWRWQKIELRSTASHDHHRQAAPGVWARWVVPILKAQPTLIVVVWLIIIVAVGTGVSRLSTSAGTHKLLSPEDKLVKDYAWLEEHVGALVPLELVVRFAANPDQTPSETFQRLAALEQLRKRFGQIAQVRSTFSAINFLPDLPTEGGLRSTARRALVGKLAHESRDRFREMRFLYSDPREESWRLSGRIAGAVTIDYESLLADVQTMIDQFQQELPALAPTVGKVDIEVSGGVPFLYRTQRQLLMDLLSSFTTAFLMIAGSMALMFRSITGGLLTMLPNVTPAAVVFGLMGWFGLEIEIGTVLTASVMMGVCVDDTLHLVTHFRSLRRRGWSHTDAVNEALNNCGGAMLQTGLVCGVGMLVFALSPFVPVARFAWLTFTLLMVGVASDIILTPAMLLSPLHHLFYWQRRGEASR